ncbi:MAG: SAM-dependent methyltransferase [Verrucomicrobia bacterium]|nr:SAM-dependent methyltransferase [Verrucomicrobiota bacterium]
MGSSTVPPSAAFLAAFRARAGAGSVLPFDEFMDLALYHRELGYYRQPRVRVGYGRDTDFFTASTSGTVFGELVAAAAAKLLAGRDPRDFTFVEIGAEPSGGVLRGVAHPFGATRTVRLGEPLRLEGRCVVFSNELFDAQPCRRFRRREGRWRELGVAEHAGRLAEVELERMVPRFLPVDAPDGYLIDAPVAAADLAGRIAGEPWTGLFLALDYGKSWREIAEATPAGTARAYFRHTQGSDLLSQPGEQDLTCHVCWDWLTERLVQAGFGSPAVESQEAFFIHHATAYLAATTSAEAGRFSPKKLSLQQLLHPAYLGQKFQALHATRS